MARIVGESAVKRAVDRAFYDRGLQSDPMWAPLYQGLTRRRRNGSITLRPDLIARSTTTP